ncbi:lamin tail domain-containing protein [Haloferula sp.]|uniref:lamin tail domain-containing protein n=1 Tax=Haloferula sp. TaxID=2497595 RepID=UPI00329EC41E
MLRLVTSLLLWAILICARPVSAQVTAFDADFDLSSTVDPTDAANLDAGTSVGSWSDLPASAESLGIFDSAGDKGFLIDRANADFKVNANLAEAVRVGDDTEISFAYAIRRSGSHTKDVTVTGYDVAGGISFQIILTAINSSSDKMRVAYSDPVSGYTNVPEGGANDHAYMGSWAPSDLAEIKLVLSSDGYVIEHDGGNGQWTSITLPYTGSATVISRIEFSGRGGSSGIAAGLWLDEVQVSGQLAQIIDSFVSDSSFVSPGESVDLSWQLSGYDHVLLDGVDVTDLTSDGSGGITQVVTETRFFELVASQGSYSQSASVLVFAGDFPLMITEVMSDNDNTLEVADGSSPDWIEIANFSDTSFDLAGWHLTDDSANLSKWTFPAGSLVPAYGTLIVFASNDPPSPGELHASFKLSSGGEYLALVQADGTTIEQEFAPSLPLMHEDVSYGLGPDLVSLGFFEAPSPGESNGALTLETGPLLGNLTENPAFTTPGILVSVEADANGSPLTGVTLHYRIGYGGESSLPMTNTSGNLWSATIPTDAIDDGEMLRWRATSSDELGRVTPFPTNVPADASPRYHGVVAPDPSITTVHPVLHWFVEDPDWHKSSGWDAASRQSKPNNKDYGPVSLSYDGRFYDNAQMRVRGNNAASWEKPKFKVELNEGYEFQWSAEEEAVDEFNLQSHFVDQDPGSKTSFIREYVYRELATEVAMPVFKMFYMQVRQNGDYYGLYSFTEQVDAAFLRRNGFPDDGALYKSTDGGTLATGSGTPDHFRKATRKDEPFDDLVALIDKLNAEDLERADFVFDHLDLPGIINKYAVDALTFNYDRVGHNYHVYHDPKKDEWTQFAWDVDRSFVINSRINNPDFAHLLFPDGLNGRSFNGMAAATLRTDAVREMYVRRLRTLMDEYLATTWMEGAFSTFDSNIATERSFDATVWPVVLHDVEDDLIDYFVPTRREQFYTTWGAEVPDVEPAGSSLSFGQIVANPVSGDQDEEFIEITNANDWAVDVSHWRISGGVSFEFPPGSVVPANSSCYLSPDVVSFRSRSTSPTGGEQRFVLGNYSGHLSNFGESLTLADDLDVPVAQITLPEAPTDNQLYLVISELMYHPEPDGEAEFIELLNTSDDTTLDLGGVRFTSGIEYTFPLNTLLPPGERIVVTKSEFTSGSLSNGGESIKLDDADGSTIFEFTYDDVAPWPVTPDTIGTSLVYISGDPTEPINWRASTTVGGNPGTSDSVAYGGGDVLAYALDGGPDYDLATGILSATKRPGADDAALIPQWSDDLESWNDDGFEFVGSEPLRWEESFTASRLYFRLKVETSTTGE